MLGSDLRQVLRLQCIKESLNYNNDIIEAFIKYMHLFSSSQHSLLTTDTTEATIQSQVLSDV